jgi:hypothetical protein
MKLALVAAAIVLAASSAAAAPPGAPLPAAPPKPGASPDLKVEAFPVFGSGATVTQGWSEITVRIQNNGSKPARGHVEVSMQHFGRGARKTFRATAPYNVGAGAAVNVRVPARVGPYGDLLVEVFGEQDNIIQETRFPSSIPQGVTLLDVSETSRLRGAIQDAAVTPLLYTGGSRSSTPTITVSVPRYDPSTGDPILPDRAALYSGADAVLVRSDVLSRQSGAELDALAGWVLGGGTIAIAIARPEDLRHPTLVALAGGAITKQGVYADTLKDFTPLAPVGSMSSSAKIVSPTSSPLADVAEALVGYTGGNLHASLYGSSATYGLGEVHLLAFDPAAKPAVDDPWVQARMIDLARRAFDRRTTQALRPSDRGATSFQRIRRQLDPNESSRWAIGAAAILLCAYALLAGPLSFSLATKAQRPLRALRWLPLFSAITFAIVVAIGVASKGLSGRARHLTYIEAGAGMTKGTARRFRGFFASRAKDLTVRTTDASSIVSTAVLPEYADNKDHLIVDREGARLVEVAALPWQTIVVGEEGFAEIGHGIALVREGEGLAVINRTGHDMRAAIVRGPDGKGYYFPRIKDGERVVTAAARALGAKPDGALWESYALTPRKSGALDLHHLSAHALRPIIENDAPGLTEAWRAIEDVASDVADWFPDNVPSLIAQLDGGEGRLSDAGLRIESDRVLVRVVGFGGRP